MFIIPFYTSYFLNDGKTGTRSNKSKGKNNELEENFHIACRYLNIIKKQEDNFIANRKFTSGYNIKSLKKIIEKNAYAFLMKGEVTFPALKGINSWL